MRYNNVSVSMETDIFATSATGSKLYLFFLLLFFCHLNSLSVPVSRANWVDVSYICMRRDVRNSEERISIRGMRTRQSTEQFKKLKESILSKYNGMQNKVLTDKEIIRAKKCTVSYFSLFVPWQRYMSNSPPSVQKKCERTFHVKSIIYTDDCHSLYMPNA